MGIQKDDILPTESVLNVLFSVGVVIGLFWLGITSGLWILSLLMLVPIIGFTLYFRSQHDDRRTK